MPCENSKWSNQAGNMCKKISFHLSTHFNTVVDFSANKELFSAPVKRSILRELFLFLNDNKCCVPSLEPSCRDGSDGDFFLRNMENYLCFPFLSGTYEG